MEPYETLHVDKAEYEQVQRDAIRKCGPHTCARSRRWKLVAMLALGVMVCFGGDKLYREDARNATLRADIQQEVASQMGMFQASVPELVRAALPDGDAARRLVDDLTSLRDDLRRQAWVAQTPEQERDLDVLRRLEALERR